MARPNKFIQKSLPLANDFFNQGQKEFIKGKDLSAIKKFSLAIELDNTFIDAFKARSLARMNTGEHLKAIEDCDSALNIEQSNIDILLIKSNIYVELGDYKNSILTINRAINLNQNDPSLYIFRAAIKYDKFFTNGIIVREVLCTTAIKDLEKGLNINPNYEVSKYESVQINLIYNNLEAALKGLNEQIALNSDLTKAKKLLITRSFVKSNLLDFDGAIEDCQKAIGIKSNCLPSDYIRLAIYNAQKGDLEVAISILESINDKERVSGMIKYLKKSIKKTKPSIIRPIEFIDFLFFGHLFRNLKKLKLPFSRPRYTIIFFVIVIIIKIVRN